MAESSQPQIGLIIRVGAIGIATVVFVRLGLVSYFGTVEDTEHQRKYIEMGKAARDVNLNARAEEMKALASGATPIDKAMQIIASQSAVVAGLEHQPANPAYEKDTLAGWREMPREVPSSLLAPPPSASAPPAASGAPAPSASASSAPAPSASTAPPAPSGSAPPAPRASANPAPNPAPGASNH